MHFTQIVEPPYAERHVRWCERSAAPVRSSLLLYCMRGMCADLSVKVRYRLVSRNCKRKTRVSIARWNLKEVRSKLLARRTETAYKAYSGRMSLHNKAKSNADRTLKCKCGGYMEGRSTHLSAEVSPERTGTKGPAQPMQ